MSAYNWEYSDHPDLACTWAVDEAFLGLFAQVSLVISSAVTGRPASSYPLGVLLEYLSQLCREPSMPVLWQQGGLQLLWQYIRILHLQGFSAYREGSWLQAKQILEQTKFMRRTLLGQPLQDGPSNTLLNFMAGHDYMAPFTWKGYRELTDK